MPSERVQRQIDRLLDEAEQAMGLLEWQIVRQRVGAVFALDPENEDATTYMAAAERAESGHAGAPGPPEATKPATESETPTSFSNGRYTVKKFVGEGGKKKVYLAHDAQLDRDIAFALIKTEGLDEAGRERITREAQSMGRLGAHPHIVTVFEYGDEGGAPFLVTELMGGGDVEGILEDAPDNRVPLEQALEIAGATCRGLEFAHSRGIVHRDLKPGNVWLTADGVAKIGDFGLAVAIDRSRLTQHGMMVGTVSYMPPEQALGGEVTPKADLYSLGAMLYEMVTGRPPFLGDDSVAIIGQHINTAPVAPSWHCSCPKPLEALILRLLSKDPAERPESASDVLAALVAIDPTVVDTTVEEQENVLDSLAGGVFVGRRAEMDQLKAALEEALSGKGRLVTLVGEPGIGKTRTAQELVTFASMRGMQVLWGRCYEEQGVPPYWPWVQAIREYVHERNADELRSELGSAAAVIAEIVTDVRDALPGLQAPPEVSREEARFRLLDSVATFLKSASRNKPLMLVLDDLHWADEATLSLLQFVARELGNARVLVIGTYRDMELNRQHPLAETLAELTRVRLFERVLLRGLSAADVGSFMELTSGLVPPKGLVEAVHKDTEGNPLFVTEVVRLLVQDGELTPEKVRERGTGSWEIRIPEGIREVIGRRLNRLSERCNDVLTTAAVVGRAFEMRVMSSLMSDNMTEGMLLDVLEEALNARVIEELSGSVGRYQFTHALIQETLTDDLSLTRRVRLHARIAETLEALYGDRTKDHAVELAHHFAQAEAMLGSDKLVEYSLFAGQAALVAYAFEDAEAIYRRALNALEGSEMDESKADLTTGLGMALGGSLRWAEGWPILEEAFNYYEAAGLKEKALAIVIYPDVHAPSRGLSGASLAMERAVELAEPDSAKRAYVLMLFGVFVSVDTGDDDRSVEIMGRAFSIAEDLGDMRLQMEVLAGWSEVDFWRAKASESLPKAIRAANLAVELDDPNTESFARFYVSICRWIGELDMEAAVAESQLAIKAAERAMGRSSLPATLYLHGLIQVFRGRFDEAADFLQQAHELAPEDEIIQASMANFHNQAGRLELADTFLDRMWAGASGPGRKLRLGLYVFVANYRLTVEADEQIMARVEEITEEASNTRIPLMPPVMIARIKGLIAELKSDAEGARSAYDRINEEIGDELSVGVAGPLSNVLANLAVAFGDLDLANEHFTQTLPILESGGFRTVMARVLYEYGDMLLTRDGDGDRKKANQLLEKGLLLSRDIGMPWLTERILARREILKA